MSKKKIIFENVSMPAQNNYKAQLDFSIYKEGFGLVNKFISKNLILGYFFLLLFAIILSFVSSPVFFLTILPLSALFVSKAIEEYKFYLVKKDFEENGIF